MRVVRQLQPAFVLHRRDYRNTSLLLDVFSARYGRVGLVAKGARRGKTALGPMLQPFRPLLLSWTGRGELQTLTAAETAADAVSLQGSALLCGFYLNELLLRLLTRDDDQAGLFDHYTGTLRALGGGDAGEALLLRGFEQRLLQESGYGLVLEHCAEDGSVIEPSRRYRYHPEHGPMTTLSGDGVVVSGSTLRGLASGELDAQGQREAKLLLRAALAPHLGERPMHSRSLYQQYLQLGAGGRKQQGR